MKMAANNTSEKTTKASAENKLSTYDLIIGILALFSLVLLILLIFVPLSPETEDLLISTENLLCFVFLFDFFRSLFRSKKKLSYFFVGGGWLDLLGSLPLSQLAVFRVVRLFRILRIMRTLRVRDFRTILTRRLAESTLLFTLVVALLLIFILSGIVLSAEHAASNANIKTYPEAVWWAFVTIATVGYGDYYPVTTLGRTGAIILMFFGIGIIGVLSSYLSTIFISREQRRKERIAGEKEGNDKEKEGDDSTSRDAELAAIRQELAELRKLFEDRDRKR
jgi:voltage-gated potassium channel